MVVKKAAPLVFREWTPDARLEPGVWNIPVPVDGALLEPSVVIAPLGGFDRAGFRLGYGGGYSAARLDTIHPLPHEIPMQTTVTEDGVFEIER